MILWFSKSPITPLIPLWVNCHDVSSLGELTIGFDAPVKKMKVLETSGKVEICISASENINGIITMEVVIPSFSDRGT